MIVSFNDEESRKVFITGKSRRFGKVARTALRRLIDLDTARDVHELRNPPGNRLEKLIGDREGQWSIRINAQYRLCFVWTGEDASEVEIVDYH